MAHNRCSFFQYPRNFRAFTTALFSVIFILAMTSATVRGSLVSAAYELDSLYLSNRVSPWPMLGSNTNEIVSLAAPLPSTLVVNSTADTDDGLCSSDPDGCNFRHAINAAN